MLGVFLHAREICDAAFYLPCSSVPEGYLDFIKSHVPSEALFTGGFPYDGEWDLVVVDKRSTTVSEMEQWDRSKWLFVGVDEGGDARGMFHLLIDTLPFPGGDSANISDICLLDLPGGEFRRKEPPALKSLKGADILVSFGGEDPFHLTEEVLSFFEQFNRIHLENITVVEGPLFGKRPYSPEVRVLKNVDSLREILYRYDLVFTSFGLTAYEAVCAGSYAVLLNPTEYHSRLAQKAGFSEVGVGRIRKKELTRFLNDPGKIKIPSLGCGECGDRSLGEVISSLVPSPVKSCPVCGSRDRESVSRFSDRSFFRCSTCSIIYQVHFAPLENSYRKDYFFSEYMRQYGKTYLDDFPNLRKLAGERLKIINKYTSGGKLLDVGCAYGPFLAEAEAEGFEPSGVELVNEAADYVSGELGFEVVRGTFEKAEITGTFDVVTMWYVIEHFTELKSVLEKVNAILRSGGLFAFSTPNSSGITGKSGRFFSGSPADHYTVWNPESAVRILTSMGFEVKRIRITGHHPERFPGFLGRAEGIGRKILSGISRMTGLGDTFEVYAVKVRSISSDE